jgi:uncharacterized protein (UPF0262 family)
VKGKDQGEQAPRRVMVEIDLALEASYYSAIRTASPTQIEAIDMGRRGLHNEASELLRHSGIPQSVAFCRVLHLQAG